MKHVVLLGDSIFDNASYVPGELPVIDQLRSCISDPWQATLLAEDGAYSTNVLRQLVDLPENTSHLVISCGGNDALRYKDLLHKGHTTNPDSLEIIARAREEFQKDYIEMLAGVLILKKPTVVCTIYDSVPDLNAIQRSALATFNEIILREAAKNKLPVLDLRIICTESVDYSTISSIEPSARGGEKIAEAIGDMLAQHDFSLDQCILYS